MKEKTTEIIFGICSFIWGIFFIYSVCINNLFYGITSIMLLTISVLLLLKKRLLAFLLFIILLSFIFYLYKYDFFYNGERYKCDGRTDLSNGKYDNTYPFCNTKVYFKKDSTYNCSDLSGKFLFRRDDIELPYCVTDREHMGYGETIKLCYINESEIGGGQEIHPFNCTKKYHILPTDDCLYFDMDMNLISRECVDGIYKREDYLNQNIR